MLEYFNITGWRDEMQWKRSMALETYKRKRDFTKTSEPEGKVIASQGKLMYSLQKHDASRLHYDLRLEWDGVLLSWAIPKGPSMDPADKRLAVRVEDHPVEYRTFEGTIPKGEYGGGTVLLLDTGTWEPLMPVDKALQKGELKFNLHGKRLKGRFVLIQLKNSEDAKNWLLIKERDEYVLDEAGLDQFTTGVLSGQTMKEIAQANLPTPDKQIPPKRRKASGTLKTLTLKTLLKQGHEELPFNEVQVNLAELREKTPSGDQWLHEIKFDGYRIVAFLENGKPRLMSRNGLNWTSKFTFIATSLAEWLDGTNAVLDGEIVVLDENNRSDFQSLQQAIKDTSSADLKYMVFDLLALGSTDLRELPLRQRKALLNQLMDDAPPDIVYSPEVSGNGPALSAQSCNQGLEGIISKLAESAYLPGRGGNWIKSKCSKRQEFVIVGYTISAKAIGGLSSLLLGYYENKKLVYAGRTGTGFKDRDKSELIAILKPIIIKEPTVDLRGDKRAGEQIVWVKPELVAEVQFAEWTDDHLLRQASYKGLREDKMPKSVSRETAETPAETAPQPKRSRKAKLAEVKVANVRISSPDKLMFPADTITKAEVAAYYDNVAALMLPHLRSRPVSLFRTPDGIDGEGFFMKHYNAQMPEVQPIEIEENDGDKVTYMSIKSKADLLGAVQMSAIEFHVWGSRVKKLEQPDMLVFDLDPDEGLTLEILRGGVKDLHGLIEELHLEAFLKTSGGKGYHIVVPLTPKAGWEQARDFARNIAEVMAQKWPRKYTANMRKAERKGRIYIDWVRNGRGSTSVAPYSLRARPTAPVSCPIDWDDLGKIAPADVTLKTLELHLKHDPWAGYFDVKQALK